MPIRISDVQRRQLLLATLPALPMLVLPRLHVSPAGLERPDAHALATLESLFVYPAHARAVGRWYLEHYPDRARPAALLAGAGLSRFLNRRHLPPALVRGAIVETSRRDYLSGQTVMLDGWIVPRAQACVCALLALWGRRSVRMASHDHRPSTDRRRQ